MYLRGAQDPLYYGTHLDEGRESSAVMPLVSNTIEQSPTQRLYSSLKEESCGLDDSRLGRYDPDRLFLAVVLCDDDDAKFSQFQGSIGTFRPDGAANQAASHPHSHVGPGTRPVAVPWLCKEP